MPKVSESIIFNQINEYIESFLSNLQTGFRAIHTIHCTVYNGPSVAIRQSVCALIALFLYTLLNDLVALN